ncbi:MAG TPA: TerB family tellurite resistance protein [Polyangiaceae bacterium]|nr:TerB family tellurite resistance protein [Polyangiaceae bacterium]
MFGWFKADETTDKLDEEQALTNVVRDLLPAADAETVQIVSATAGLLACVAFADRDYSAAEEKRIHELLTTVDGLDVAGADAVLRSLRAHARSFSAVQSPHFCRTLRQLGDRELRAHVLELLVEVAAADHEITHNEVTVLRQLTTALGLEQADYNTAQEKHRSKLAALR